jgi:hypothetical protein
MEAMTNFAQSSDECAAPLEKPQAYRSESTAPKKKDAPLKNRFQLLNVDGDDGSVESDDHDHSGLTFQTALSPSTLGVFA